MQFLHPQDEHQEVTYDDVFLTPVFSDIASRQDVDLTPTDGLGTALPLVLANMTAIAGKRMAETVARRGGIAVLPQDLTDERLREVIPLIQSSHPVYETPVLLHESKTIQHALNLIYKRAHGAVVVIDSSNKPVGIFTDKDAYQRDRFTPLREVMSREIISMPDTASVREVFTAIKQRRVHVMPILHPDGTMAGVLTEKGCVRATVYKPALNTRQKLLTAAALGINQETEQKLRLLLELEVDVIVLDTAHGHQKKMLNAVARARALFGNGRTLVAGNVVTEQATRDLITAGATIVKVGVGPGAACSTRMMTGVGRPQFSAVRACAAAAHSLGAHVWADGGIKHPRDVALALAAGASSVMIGSWFTGTYESPADIQRDEHGNLYKENFGMASRRAVIDRTRTQGAFSLSLKQFFNEGISVSKMYLREGQESAEDIIDMITAGLRSACTYSGARTLEEFYQKAVVGIQTPAAYAEGKPQEKSW